ncbi:hypothetical protein ACJX0J_018175, partial [Zea mays]
KTYKMLSLQLPYTHMAILEIKKRATRLIDILPSKSLTTIYKVISVRVSFDHAKHMDDLMCYKLGISLYDLTGVNFERISGTIRAVNRKRLEMIDLARLLLTTTFSFLSNNKFTS